MNAALSQRALPIKMVRSVGSSNQLDEDGESPCNSIYRVIRETGRNREDDLLQIDTGQVLGPEESAYRILQQIVIMSQMAQTFTVHGGFAHYLYRLKLKESYCACDRKETRCATHSRGVSHLYAGACRPGPWTKSWKCEREFRVWCFHARGYWKQVPPSLEQTQGKQISAALMTAGSPTADGSRLGRKIAPECESGLHRKHLRHKPLRTRPTPKGTNAGRPACVCAAEHARHAPRYAPRLGPACIFCDYPQFN
ncbi:hypothetical protein EVAR_100104_1 [Eumeta japonica]|uniref:Uncharacterized protein n=1 Tax=Eumeta variegata TaxID=151549 RepID=A0A4C1YW40_EUMVA|nr:hypothetical protein EVAR_100104_1 [Eumeta japonica]